MKGQLRSRIVREKRKMCCFRPSYQTPSHPAPMVRLVSPTHQQETLSPLVNSTDKQSSRSFSSKEPASGGRHCTDLQCQRRRAGREHGRLSKVWQGFACIPPLGQGIN
ncbi:hypothetical protein HaLaN_24692 [Haematococcus lacustris]|uniref:Uncharacterized protein n=1 Tax=Haematococcus lacustris TaxID=44745 RepID=A0A699ZUG3_HAELA|nr:hypothetical protein HaLaN_24692 [Haematococcus lacustris]